MGNTRKFIELPSLEEINKFVSYKVGFLYSNKTGLKLDSKTKRGYYYVYIAGRQYLTHRIVWKIFNKTDPNGLVDHIDQNPLNNKIENLRVVNDSLNKLNNSKNGFYFNKNSGKYMARITLDSEEIYLGLFNTPEEASAAYQKKKVEFFQNNAEVVNALQ